MIRNTSIILLLFFAVLFVFGSSPNAQTTSINHVENCRDETAISYVYGEGIYPNQIDIEAAKYACRQAQSIVNADDQKLAAEIDARLGIVLLEENDKQGLDLVLKAYESGNELAATKVADFYFDWFKLEKKRGNEERATSALNVSQEAATTAFEVYNNPHALYLLGHIAIELNTSGPADPLVFFQYASELGHSDASLLYAKILENGWLGHVKNIDKARTVLTGQSERFGDPYAALDLAKLNLYEPRDNSDVISAAQEFKSLFGYWNGSDYFPHDLYFSIATFHLSERWFDYLKQKKLTELIDIEFGYEGVKALASNPDGYDSLLQILNMGAPSQLTTDQKAEILALIERATVIGKNERDDESKKINAAMAAVTIGTIEGDGLLGIKNLDRQRHFLKLAADEYGSIRAKANLGWLLFSKQEIYDLEEAARYTWEAQFSKDQYIKAVALNNLGVIYQHQRQARYIDQAVKFWEQAEGIFEKIDQRERWPSMNLSEAYLFGMRSKGRDVEKALIHAKRAEAISGAPNIFNYVLERNDITNDTDDLTILSMFEEAAEGGQFDALSVLGNYHEFAGNDFLAAKWFAACTLMCSDRNGKASNESLDKVRQKITGKELEDASAEATKWSIKNINGNKVAGVIESEPDTPVKNNGRMFALLIGVASYEDSRITPLRTPLKDINDLSRLLIGKYGFLTEVLENPSRSDITKRLNAYRSTLQDGDSFLIYFAGHGIEANGEGFWLPADAEYREDTNYIDHSYIRRKISEFDATNILVISDSCFRAISQGG